MLSTSMVGRARRLFGFASKKSMLFAKHRRQKVICRAVMDTLEPRLLMAGENLVTYVADSAVFGGLFERSLVTEARAGNRATNGTFELDAGTNTTTPEVQSQLAWSNGSVYDFTVNYTGGTSGTISIEMKLGGSVISSAAYSGTFGATEADAISLRVRNSNTNTANTWTLAATDMQISFSSGGSSAVAVPSFNSAGNADMVAANGADSTMFILGEDLQGTSGFTLTGKFALTWSGAAPTNSNLAMQVAIGRVKNLPSGDCASCNGSWLFSDPSASAANTQGQGGANYQGDDAQRQLTSSQFGQTIQNTQSSVPSATRWPNSKVPILVPMANKIFLVENSAVTRVITRDSGGSYSIESFTRDEFEHTSGYFVITDTKQQKMRFKDFAASRDRNERGQFVDFTDSEGIVTAATSTDSNGQVTELQTDFGDAIASTTYSYDSYGNVLTAVERTTTDVSSSTPTWTVQRQYEYSYRTPSTVGKSSGVVQSYTIKDASGNILDENYIKSYTSATSTGYAGAQKYVLGRESVERIKLAYGLSTVAAIDTLSDAQIAPYADATYEYDSQRRITKIIRSGNGCSGCSSAGQGTYTYSYTTSSFSDGVNTWKYKLVENLPDGNQKIYYADYAGRQMLEVFTNVSTSAQWITFTRYNAEGQAIFTATPSAVTGYDEAYGDLVRYISGNAYYIADSNGLISLSEYGSATTATDSTDGDVDGYLKATYLQRGETGTAVKQSATTYLSRTTTSGTVYNVATSVRYRNTDGTGAQTTAYSYTYATDSTRVTSLTTTLPIVTTSQNGSGVASTSATVYDTRGRSVWSKDADGYITYTEYDPATSGVVTSIVDVDTAQTSTFTGLPSGWATPSGGGLHLTTTYEVDELGRTIKMTDPNGNVSYTVYSDVAHEVRTYHGWNSTTNQPTLPVEISRKDKANGYTERSTATWTSLNVSGGRPVGDDSLSSATLQTLSRSITNTGGQVVQTLSYHNLTGVTYSASTVALGTAGTNYYLVSYGYDKMGRSERTVSATATITFSQYDALGRAVGTWIGTNDTPSSDLNGDGNTNYLDFRYYLNANPNATTGPTGTNMKRLNINEYDNGGVGDSNLTKSTQLTQDGSDNRVTTYAYDWRDRLVATKTGVKTTENASDNTSFITYSQFDNLGQTVASSTFDGDTLSITTDTNSDGVPDMPTSSALRAYSTAEYDELGRAFKTSTYSVDPSTGTVSSSAIISQSWFNQRGMIIKSGSNGQASQKMQYDGVGRTAKSFVVDASGDSSWADALTVTGDTVLEQSENTYDENGNVILITVRQRFHNATGTGELGDPSSTTQPKARVSYSASYYDLANRLTNSVNVGTNGANTYSRPDKADGPSATKLATAYKYNDAGWLEEVVDPRTISTLTHYDNLGRTTEVIEAHKVYRSLVLTPPESPTITGWSEPVTVTWSDELNGYVNGPVAIYPALNAPELPWSVQFNDGTDFYSFDVSPADWTPVTHLFKNWGFDLGEVVGFLPPVPVGSLPETVTSRVTRYTYNANGQILTVTADMPSGQNDQTTEYVYGVDSSNGSAIASNDLLRLVKYPNKSTGAASTNTSDQNSFTYNALGQTLTKTDQNSTVHTYTYDILGRMVSDAVTIASGNPQNVDTSVLRIETTYSTQGQVETITSYDATSGGNVVNQIKREYNGLGQMTREYQAHSGPVNTSTTPYVGYAYDTLANGARLIGMTYPNGKVLSYNYGTTSSLNDNISRLESLSETAGMIENYEYLGAGTVAQRSQPQAGIRMSYIKLSSESAGDAGDQYTGLDRFGRVVDQRWLNSSDVSIDRYGYTYDENSNRLSKVNSLNSALNETYTYDTLNRLTSATRGGVAFQDWDLDALGNMNSVTTNSTTETRTHNSQNQLTGMGSSTLTFDHNGNTITDDKGNTLVYDAWNRLISVSDGSTLVMSYAYDGLTRRIVETDPSNSASPKHLYYSSNWQIVEERLNSNTDVEAQYVWSPVYVDALVLRDKDIDNSTSFSTDERIFAMQDANFNVTGLVTYDTGTSTWAVSERFVNDPYGTFATYDASWTAASDSFLWQHHHQGLLYSSATGLYWNRNREYSSVWARFAQRDPLPDIMFEQLSIESQKSLLVKLISNVYKLLRDRLINEVWLYKVAPGSLPMNNWLSHMADRLRNARPELISTFVESAPYQYVSARPTIATDPAGLAPYLDIFVCACPTFPIHIFSGTAVGLTPSLTPWYGGNVRFIAKWTFDRIDAIATMQNGCNRADWGIFVGGLADLKDAYVLWY